MNVRAAESGAPPHGRVSTVRNINDKHVEVIAWQMMRWVKIEGVGDTEFMIDEQVHEFRFAFLVRRR